MKTHEEIRDDLPLYALGALEPGERAAVEAALASGDAELADELRSWTQLIGLIGLESPQPAPPEVKARLLARVRADAASAPPKQPKLARRSISWAVPVAAAAAAVLAIEAYREIGAHAEHARAEEAVRGLEKALAATKADLDESTAALTQSEGDVRALRAALTRAEASLSVVEQPDFRIVALQETEQAAPAAGHMVFSASTGRAIFFAYDLPPVPPEKVYALWWITEREGPVRAVSFQPDKHGVAHLTADVARDAGAIRAAAVTIERASAVSKPEGPMVLIGSMIR
ncbi:MAG: anti-sigma factor [Candidatus Binatia bacterium]